jgi:hypothetical protein
MLTDINGRFAVAVYAVSHRRFASTTPGVAGMEKKYDDLVLRKAELEKRLAAIYRDLGGGLDRDFEEQSIQLENFAVLQEIARVAQNELREIDARLARFAESA